mmetsp:Transcript_48212/g.120540  ORF Transcript_48212/g.120540 Transcript_48212/m.120540 type:complete len:254 (+) Transcript_48212:163-924(+)|eukprot:CAMPEP_0173436046 /NCGR_PEP_ID=MMETSP1357-20121228/15729_1 /TAXON_ID=77926 /ORGANISM="Hemiselmis rufescens, Strain PCC563" /LENGTH=253 /DNA_ID=CAMNT_0014401093 /DNA_START=163 /DNA_END=924 /DNA_ORIENTATION=+
MAPHCPLATGEGQQEASHQHSDAEIEFEVVLEWLQRVCSANDILTAGKPIPCTVFHGQQAPDISFRGYLERLRTFSGCSPACFVVAVSYLERLGELEPDMRINSINMHRLMLTAAMVACKLFDETFYCNAYWARVGGVPPSEMNKLELEFLFLIKFDLHRTKEHYDEVLKRLVFDTWDGRALPYNLDSLGPVPMSTGAGEGSPTNVVDTGSEARLFHKAIQGARRHRPCTDAAETASEAMKHAQLRADAAQRA